MEGVIIDGTGTSNSVIVMKYENLRPISSNAEMKE